MRNELMSSLEGLKQPNIIGSKNGRNSSGALNREALPAVVVAPVKRVRKIETDYTERNKLVLEYLPLVRLIALRICKGLPVHVDLDDLIHEGILGLINAAGKFKPDTTSKLDPTKKVKFSSYAKEKIKGAILDSLRQLDWSSREMRRRRKQIKSAVEKLEFELKRTPSEEEVIKELGISVERWREMMLDLQSTGPVSSTGTGENPDLPILDPSGDPKHHPDIMSESEQRREELAEAIRTLPERYQKVVVSYYTKGMTMKKIGGLMGINESRVSQIRKAALEKMKAKLRKKNINSSRDL